MVSESRNPFHSMSPRRRSASVPASIVAEDDRHETRSSVVDNGIYVDGCRVATPSTLGETFEALEQHPGAMAWIGLYRPNTEELTSLADQFNLHELSVEDAIHAHQRPKLERYEDSTFLVLRAARYLDDTESVEFGELHVFVGANFVITLRHSEAPDLSVVRARLESTPELLALGPESVLYAILDAVVDGYMPVVAGLENDIDEIETQVFDGDPSVSRRIYELSREVIDFQRAAQPLVDILQSLSEGFERHGVDASFQQYLRDVDDHVVRVIERVDEFRELLRDMLTVNATLVAQRQNDEMQRVGIASNRQAEEARKISGWAAILFAPSLIGSVYGMNFRLMPELHWQLGYPFAIVLMLAVSGTLYAVFHKRGWI